METRGEEEGTKPRPARTLAVGPRRKPSPTEGAKVGKAPPRGAQARASMVSWVVTTAIVGTLWSREEQARAWSLGAGRPGRGRVHRHETPGQARLQLHR